MMRIIADLVTSKIAGHIDQHISQAVRTQITPAFTTLAIGTAQQVAGEVERRTIDQIRQMDAQNRNYSAKIDQLAGLVRSLADTVQTMASAQSNFQSEISRLQQQLASPRNEATVSTSASTQVTEPPKDRELSEIEDFMKQGRYEEGTVRVRLGKSLTAQNGIC